MPLPSSGQITINQIHVEAGGGSGSQAAINDSDIRAMIGKGSAAQNAGCVRCRSARKRASYRRPGPIQL